MARVLSIIALGIFLPAILCGVKANRQITLQPMRNPSNLCIRTAQLNFSNSIMKLAPCDKVYPNPSIQGVKEFGQWEVTSDAYNLATVHVPVGSAYGIYGCMYTGYNGGGFGASVLTDACWQDNPWHNWIFFPIGQNVLWLHKQTGYCIRLQSIVDGAVPVTAVCNERDENQLWKLIVV